MKFNVHAGHNPDGKIACGACGLIKESTEARKVKKELSSCFVQRDIPCMIARVRMAKTRRMS